MMEHNALHHVVSFSSAHHRFRRWNTSVALCISRSDKLKKPLDDDVIFGYIGYFAKYTVLNRRTHLPAIPRLVGEGQETMHE